MVERFLPRALVLLGCLIAEYERQAGVLAVGGTAAGTAGLRPFAAGSQPPGLPPAQPGGNADGEARPPEPEEEAPDDGTGGEPPDRSDQAYQPEVIGILSIPRIDLTVAIAEGTDDRSLRYAVGHFTETAGPGEPGNFALVGHRGHIYGPFFLRLDQVEAGDPIFVQSDGATYIYRVSEAFVVQPDETWVLNPTEEPQITLITCTPKWINTHRLVVRGVLEAADFTEPARTAGAS